MPSGGEKYAQMTMFESLLAMAGTATLALIFSLLFGLDWKTGCIIVGTTALFTGGAVFTFVEVRRLGVAAKDERGPADHNARESN